MKNNKNLLTPLIVFFVILFCVLTYVVQKYSPHHFDPNNAKVESIVKEYILNHPEVIVDSLKNLETKNANNYMENMQKSIRQNKDMIEATSNAPVFGDINSDIILVQFYDYRCGYCKKFSNTLSKLLAEDHKVRVVFREFPILGEKSNFAARMALAVNSLYPDKFMSFHDKLMEQGDISKEIISNILQELHIGYDEIFAKSQEEVITEILAENRKIAQESNVAGTPSVIINGEFIPNPYDLNVLKDYIKRIRENNDH